MRPKSASHCCGATSPPERRPWSSSVYIDRKSSIGQSDKLLPNSLSNRKLGHIPAYIKKRRSTASLDKTCDQSKSEERLEDEAPPPLVPSEIERATKPLPKEGTFNKPDRDEEETVPKEICKQLEDKLRDLTEEKQMLLAQNQWDQEELASRSQIIETQRQRNRQLETALRQTAEEMDQMRNVLICTADFEQLRQDRDRLKAQVEKLTTENDSLRKENETFRKQNSGDMLCLEEDPEPNQPNPTVEILERNLEKYRAARRVLKGVIEKLIMENHRLRESMENHRNEGSFVENLGAAKNADKQDKGDSEDEEEIVNRAEHFEQRRKQKRSQQKCIDVRKYES